MEGLYNAIFGINPATELVAPMLTEEDPRGFFPRFRDCYVEDGNIVVYTRVGGGNRDCGFGEDKLYELPTFIETRDDDFDNTYGYYVFGVPDEWKADFELVMTGRFGDLSDAYVERIAKCFDADAAVIREDLAATKMDPEMLGSAPDWREFFDILRGEKEI